jgi:hypothetical protein
MLKRSIEELRGCDSRNLGIDEGNLQILKALNPHILNSLNSQIPASVLPKNLGETSRACM